MNKCRCNKTPTLVTVGLPAQYFCSTCAPSYTPLYAIPVLSTIKPIERMTRAEYAEMMSYLA